MAQENGNEEKLHGEIDGDVLTQQKRTPPANCNGRQDVILWHKHNISHKHKKCQQKIAHTHTPHPNLTAFSIPLVYIRRIGSKVTECFPIFTMNDLM